MNNKKGIAFAVLTALLWGFLAILIKVVLKEVSSLTVVWVRMTVAFLGVAIFYLIKKPSAFHVFSHPPRLLWLAAPALSINYMGYSLGVELAGPATAQVVIQLGVVLLCLSGFFIFKEHFVARQIFGFLLVFTGLFFFYHQQLVGIDVGRDRFVKGVSFTVIGALAWTTYSIAQKKLVVDYPVQQINLFLYAFSSLVYLPFVDFTEFQGLDFNMYVLLFFLGMNTLVAYGAIGAALKYTDAGKVSVVIILNPLITFGALGLMELFGVDWIVFDQVPFWAYVGALMMLVGAICATVAPRKKR